MIGVCKIGYIEASKKPGAGAGAGAGARAASNPPVTKKGKKKK
jgi:hypothetical protein